MKLADVRTTTRMSAALATSPLMLLPVLLDTQWCAVMHAHDIPHGRNWKERLYEFRTLSHLVQPQCSMLNRVDTTSQFTLNTAFRGGYHYLRASR